MRILSLLKQKYLENICVQINFSNIYFIKISAKKAQKHSFARFRGSCVKLFSIEIFTTTTSLSHLPPRAPYADPFVRRENYNMQVNRQLDYNCSFLENHNHSIRRTHVKQTLFFCKIVSIKFS